MDNQIKSLLSLCRKAGFLVSGEFACEKALQTGAAVYVIVAEDASDNTKKKFVNKAFYYNVPSIIYGDKALLSSAIGKTNRAVVIITNEGFGLKIKEKIDTVANSHVDC